MPENRLKLNQSELLITKGNHEENVLSPEWESLLPLFLLMKMPGSNCWNVLGGYKNLLRDITSGFWLIKRRMYVCLEGQSLQLIEVATGGVL